MGPKGPNTGVNCLDGSGLKEALAAGTRCLERYCDAINALNVFPVPDGDTGTNMLLTMRSVGKHVNNSDTASVHAVAQKASRGALLGARGNSGVILSQFLTGFAQSLEGLDTCNARSLGQALSQGSRAAYTAVSQPVEGTMLTVMRQMAQAADEEASAQGTDVIEVWTRALEAARRSLAETPFLLPVLREAGVVDSGGQGLVVLMEGGLCSLTGKDVDTLDLGLDATGQRPLEVASVSREFLAATEQEKYGFCTQFIVEGSVLDLDELRNRISNLGTSAVVVGDASIAKVHVHTFNPDDVLSYGATLGTTSQIKIDDIDQQHQGFMAHNQYTSQDLDLAVVAVAWGEGFASLFRDLGCHSVVTCGRTMNPSARELAEAIQSTGARDVILLPNNPNVILTAHQASAISRLSVHCIPTTTLPQGVSALLAYSSELPIQQVLEAMERSTAEVKTLEVTAAVKDTFLSGIPVGKGQIMGLLDGKLVSRGTSPLAVLKEGLNQANPPEGGVVTLYWGGDVGEPEARAATADVEALFPGLEVEVVHGGQPYYHYIASVE